jgi:hypothetical protein
VQKRAKHSYCVRFFLEHIFGDAIRLHQGVHVFFIGKC